MGIDHLKQRRAEIKGILSAIRDSGDVQDVDSAESLVAEYKSISDKIDNFESSEGIKSAMQEGNVVSGVESKSLGDHFVKNFGEKLAAVKGQKNFSVSGPEFKGAADWHLTWDGLTGFNTDYDKTVYGVQPPLYVGDLFAQGTTSSAAVAWMEDAGFEGDAGVTTEGAKKNNLHVKQPKVSLEALKKITAILAFSDEMMEDHAWLVSNINQKGVYRLGVAEENQILNGNGTNGQLQGVLAKDGVLSFEAPTADAFADGILQGAMNIMQESGFTSDAVVINPQDYAALRLAKDSNGQYMGGGAFTGAYGNGGVQIVPSLWGLNTVISPRIAKGTALVGAFKAGGMLVRKGGVRIEATNSHADLFVSDVTVVRMEIRELLTITTPECFCKVTIKA